MIIAVIHCLVAADRPFIFSSVQTVRFIKFSLGVGSNAWYRIRMHIWWQYRSCIHICCRTCKRTMWKYNSCVHRCSRQTMTCKRDDFDFYVTVGKGMSVKISRNGRKNNLDFIKNDWSVRSDISGILISPSQIYPYRFFCESHLLKFSNPPGTN